MNTYNAYYNGKQIEVKASTAYDAQLKAIEVFKAPRSARHMVSVVLVMQGEKPISINPSSIG